MKIKCDICNGELMIEAGGKLALCMNCGMHYSIERLKEELKEFKNEIQ